MVFREENYSCAREFVYMKALASTDIQPAQAVTIDKIECTEDTTGGATEYGVILIGPGRIG